jgi:hypothetical protein
MKFNSREDILQNLQASFQTMMDKYDLDDIGIYEEEGPENRYFIGYTVRTDGKVYMINGPYVKNEKEELAVQEETWTIQTDEGEESEGYKNLEEVFLHIKQNQLH